MISRRPGGEHLSGSIKHTLTETHPYTHTQNMALWLDVVTAMIRQCKVVDGPDRCIGFVYQPQ